jgi:hypothetical protein
LAINSGEGGTRTAELTTVELVRTRPQGRMEKRCPKKNGGREDRNAMPGGALKAKAALLPYPFENTLNGRKSYR